MKKSNLIKALVFLTLTVATVAQAQVSPEEHDHTQGKIEAAAFNQVVEMSKEIDSIVTKIGDLQDEVGMQTPNKMDEAEDAAEYENPGVVKALGEKLDMTEAIRANFTFLATEMKSQSGDELFKSYAKANGLLEKARKNLEASKKLVVK